MFKKIIKRPFERLMWSSRFTVIFAVISGIIAAILMIAIGTYDIIWGGSHLMAMFFNSTSIDTIDKELIGHIISAIDAYLIATVLLIFSIGLYELFISELDYMERHSRSSKILMIHDLDELKEKLAKVIIMVLIVSYFKFAVSFVYTKPLDLLYLSAGILMVSLAVYFTHKKEGKKLRKE